MTKYRVSALITTTGILGALFAGAAGAATLDLSSAPPGTPVSELATPGFTFILAPGVTGQTLSGNRLSFSGVAGGPDVRIVFDGTASTSTISTVGSGSCQVGSDFVYWFAQGTQVDQLELFDTDPSDNLLSGRCMSITETRSFAHNEIQLDIFTGEQLLLTSLSNDVPTEAAPPAPIPALGGGFLALLIGLLGFAGGRQRRKIHSY